jgi:hypothetical protein
MFLVMLGRGARGAISGKFPKKQMNGQCKPLAIDACPRCCI